MFRLSACLLLAATCSSYATPSGGINYGDFTLWLDCEHRLAKSFYYRTTPDRGNTKRTNRFHFSDHTPVECRQTSTGTYRFKSGSQFPMDRGHLVPFNHWDGSAERAHKTNVMANIAPQTRTLNRGAWLKTEEIIECYRDISALEVYGGWIKGDHPDQTAYLDSHGVIVPQFFWKAVVRDDKQVIAWVFPNNNQPKRRSLDQFQVSPSKLEKATQFSFMKSHFIESKIPWPMPANCQRH